MDEVERSVGSSDSHSRVETGKSVRFAGEEEIDCDDFFHRGWVFRRNGFRKVPVFATLDGTKFDLRERAFSTAVLEQIDVRFCKITGNRARKSICIKSKTQKAISFFTDSRDEMLTWFERLESLANWDLERNYEVLEKVESDRDKVVYYAIDRRTGKRVTLRAVMKSKADKKHLEVAKLVSENLESDHVVRNMDIVESKEKVFFVEEFPDGGTLADYQRRSPGDCLPEPEARVIIRHILQAVNDLHAQDIAHRNLKLENVAIIIGKNGDVRPKISEFGMSSFTNGDLQTMRTTVGSPHFVAPEVVLNKKYDKKCDIWSCGMILFVLLTGRHAYEYKDYSDLRKTLIQFDVSATKGWDDLDPDCQKFLVRTLARNPAERYTAAQALKDPWILGES
ncbi:hypothetical protein NDN08_001179 [Rhodosorus marinus]|uniref:Protein kinase domain-containing protein n=1 Tax=Rhodosorus marinus TaxID=101924 RepID=A0AAV8UVT7_9RHOD|nr:hypothetical protein NDN08_001179 [Rhodosorus marinus]